MAVTCYTPTRGNLAVIDIREWAPLGEENPWQDLSPAIFSLSREIDNSAEIGFFYRLEGNFSPLMDEYLSTLAKRERGSNTVQYRFFPQGRGKGKRYVAGFARSLHYTVDFQPQSLAGFVLTFTDLSQTYQTWTEEL